MSIRNGRAAQQESQQRAPRQTVLSLLVASLLVPVASFSARAADDAQEPAAGSVESLSTVVITATRRREPSREVPMQVTALSADSLKLGGAQTLQDYMAGVPGVDVKGGGGAGLGTLTIRGVSTGNQTIATVGTYIDDVAVGSTNAYANGASAALDMSLLDLKHIELLRGPQGTLYGAGAMGGVLKYVTNEPDTYDLTGQVTLSAASTKGAKPSFVASGVINVPLKDDIAGLRVAAFSDKPTGWVQAVGPAAAEHSNGGTTQGARLSLLLSPTAEAKIRITDTYQDLKRDGTDLVQYDAATGQPVNGRAVRELAHREPYTLRLNVAAVDAEYDFKWARLNFISAVQDSWYDTTVDLTQAYGPLLQQFGVDVDTVAYRTQIKVKKTTQELRLTSKAGGQADWLVGLFWNHEKASNDNRVDTTFPGGEAGPVMVDARLPSDFKEVAAYGDVTWNFSKAASITAGLRVARNKQTFHEVGTSLLTGDIDTGSTSSETSKTYLLTGKYALTPKSNVYVRIASGYRPGGPNLKVQEGDPSSFGHDSLWSYELGYKADFPEQNLAVEGAVFTIRWRDLQQNLSRNGLNIIVNSGAARVNGGELSLRWAPVQPLLLSGSLSLLSASLKEGAQGLGAAGTRLPNSAKASGSFSAQYRSSLAGMPFNVGVSERYIGRRNAGFEGSDTLPNYVLPSYWVTDLQAGLAVNKTVSLGVFARNVTNKSGQLSADTSLLALGAPLMVSEERPRTFGVSLTATY